MTRGIGDPVPVAEEQQDNNDDINQVITDIILGQNKLHDRIIDLERRLDHMLADANSNANTANSKWWHKGI